MAKHAAVDLYHVPDRPGESVAGMFEHPNIRVFPVGRRPTRLGWLWRHSCFFFELAFFVEAVQARGERYDVIYAHDLPVGYAALRLAQRHRAKIIYDVHDLYLETINQLFPRNASGLKRSFFSLSKFAMRIAGRPWERLFVRHADLVLVPSPSCLVYMEVRYGTTRGLALPNYPEFRAVEPSRRLYDVTGISRDKSIVLYHGSLGSGRHLETIVRSAEFLRDDAVLVLIGNGPLETVLKEIGSHRSIRAKVRFLDSVPYEELFSLASGASLGLILLEQINLSKKYALANKLTEYMASGVAVLASDAPEHRRVLEAADAGFITTVESPEQLARRLNEALADTGVLAAKGRNGQRAFRERFNWDAYEREFVRAFQEVLEAP